MTLAFTIAEK